MVYVWNLIRFLLTEFYMYTIIWLHIGVSELIRNLIDEVYRAIINVTLKRLLCTVLAFYNHK